MLGVKNETRNGTRKSSPRRNENIYDRLERARAARQKVLSTPSPANDAGPVGPNREIKIDIRDTSAREDRTTEKPVTEPEVKKTALPKAEKPAVVTPQRLKAGPAKSRRAVLPDLAPIEPDASKLPAKAAPVIPRRITKNGVVQVEEPVEPKNAIAEAKPVAPAFAEEPVDPDAELRASIAAAFREVEDNDTSASKGIRPTRRSRKPLFFYVTLLIGAIAATFWNASAPPLPPQLVEALPATLAAPASGSIESASPTTQIDALPVFTTAAVLPSGQLNVPQPYRRPVPLVRSEILIGLPTLPVFEDAALQTTLVFETGVVRGTVSQLPALLRN